MKRQRIEHAAAQPVASMARPAGAAGAGGTMWRLDLVYEGTGFRGWARQPGLRTVEGVLMEALATILGEPVRLSVAGRTDTGVHAWAQVASFATTRHALRPDQLRRSLNAMLPPDVGVEAVAPAPDGFVARRASSRSYAYRLWLAPFKPVRERLWAWAVRGPLDTALLVEAAALLPGHRDFAALTPSAHLYHSCVREVTRAEWRPGPPDPSFAAHHSRSSAGAGPPREWVFEITAGSFLHNMVRVAVGSMVDVAQGRMALEKFAETLEGGRLRDMGQTAPPRGLALVQVTY
jgi:tRNA pseudouridine38-40 synthase